MTGTLALPPLLWDEPAPGDAVAHAAARAVAGCEAGLIAHRLLPDRIEAALVLAPEVPLRQAMAMLPAGAVGLQNALGALAPPELSVFFTWDGGIRVNGAACGRFRVMAARCDPGAVPDWLVVGFCLPLLPATEEGGRTPDQTALHVEGCADIAPAALVEAWARHTLNQIARWEEAGPRPLYEAWRGLVEGIGTAGWTDGAEDAYLGTDEDFCALIRAEDKIRRVPLTRLLEEAP